jgi:hypothetical protein
MLWKNIVLPSQKSRSPRKKSMGLKIKNLKKFRTFSWKRTDLHLIFVENTKKGKNQLILGWTDLGGSVFDNCELPHPQLFQHRLWKFAV